MLPLRGEKTSNVATPMNTRNRYIVQIRLGHRGINASASGSSPRRMNSIINDANLLYNAREGKERLYACLEREQEVVQEEMKNGEIEGEKN